MRTAPDLRGMKIGRLSPIFVSREEGESRSLWTCLCECGSVVRVRGDRMLRGHTRSCGCLLRESSTSKREIDIAGQKFGRLTAIRRAGGTGRRLQVGTYGDSKVIRRAGLVQSEVLAADQVLVGMNRTRRSFNARLRELNGFHGDLPTEGDRIICLRNNKDKGLLNGSIWSVRDVSLVPMDDLQIVTATASPADAYTAGSADVFVSVPRQFFDGTEDTLDWYTRRNFDEFDFGYAVTVHKSQGSQWDNVMLFDESSSFRDNRMNWLYTGITRAAERVTVVI